jgi:DNA polymerase
MLTPEVLEQGSLFGPAQPTSSPAEQLAEVTRAARDFRACPRWEIGTQTVFGSGPATARLMFIGGAPGQHEDKQGISFVGPGGQLFDQALLQAGLDRAEVYVTNIIKHRP